MSNMTKMMKNTWGTFKNCLELLRASDMITQNEYDTLVKKADKMLKDGINEWAIGEMEKREKEISDVR